MVISTARGGLETGSSTGTCTAAFFDGALRALIDMLRSGTSWGIQNVYI